jgi:hypothetical protein
LLHGMDLTHAGLAEGSPTSLLSPSLPRSGGRQACLCRKQVGDLII